MCKKIKFKRKSKILQNTHAMYKDNVNNIYTNITKKI